MSDPSDTLSQALALAELGYYLAPVQVTADAWGRKRVSPPLPWRKASTRNPMTLASWWGENGAYRDHGVIIDCERSGLVVVDLDRKLGSGGEQIDGAVTWAQAGGPGSPMQALTRSGGAHLYYRASPSVVIRGSAGEVAPGIDVRAAGGAVFAPPTIVRDEHGTEVGRYSWAGMPCSVDDLPPAPVHLLPQATRQAATDLDVIEDGAAREVVVAHQQAMLAAVEGVNWNTSLNALAFVTGRYCGAVGEDEHRAWAMVTAVTAQRADAAYGLDEQSSSTAWRAIRDGMATPWQIISTADLLGPPDLGEAVGLDGEADPVAAFLAQLLDDDDLARLPPPTYLVDGYVPSAGVGRLFGQSATFKSFVALDMAASVANGVTWQDRQTKQAPVWYIVAEGSAGMAQRVHAWRAHHGLASSGVRFLPRPVQLRGPEMAVMVEAARRERPGMIIFDTQARVSVGVDENSNTDAGELIAVLDQLAQATGGTVLLVHHAGHDQDRARGASAFYGALDYEIRVTRPRRTEHRIVIDVTKMKNDEERQGLELLLVGVQDTGSLVPMVGAEALRPEPDRLIDDEDLGIDFEAVGGIKGRIARRLAQIMAYDTEPGGAGRTRPEALRVAGMSTQDRTAHGAWDVLLRAGALRYLRGKSGPCEWVADPHERRPVLDD